MPRRGRPQAEVLTPQEEAAVIARAENHDVIALAELTTSRPHLIDQGVVEEGDVVRRIQETLVPLLADSAAGQQDIHRRLDRLRGDLNGPSPSPVRRRMTDVVVIDHLYYGVAVTNLKGAYLRRDGFNIEFWHRREADAQRLYLKSLTSHERLFGPTASPLLQLNVAKQQIVLGQPRYPRDLPL